MRQIKVKATHEVEVCDAKGTVSKATVKVNYHRLRVHPPIGKQQKYPLLMLAVIYAQEASAAGGREKINRRIFWMTMMNRVAPAAPPLVALTDVETQLLDRLLPTTIERPKATPSTYLVKIARSGGYLNRGRDSPLGNTVMWRGLSRITDIELWLPVGGQACG